MAHARQRDAHRTLRAGVSSNDGDNRGPPRPLPPDIRVILSRTTGEGVRYAQLSDGLGEAGWQNRCNGVESIHVAARRTPSMGACPASLGSADSDADRPFCVSSSVMR
jgi:hypothetical protein